VRRLQLANARAEQERLEAEARRMRDAAHEQQLSVMRQSLTASKVTFIHHPLLLPNQGARPYLTVYTTRHLPERTYPERNSKHLLAR
jgi:hypothetical protein